ncbi:MAG: hypothetical protein OHK0013_21670 [Sandaracinaceae bacterium]
MISPRRPLSFPAPPIGLALAVLSGCPGPDPTNDAAVQLDAPFPDTGRRFDAGPPCDEDEDCDDGVMCTRDRCGGEGLCLFQVDPTRCDDGIFCNGQEICDPRRDCQPGPRETCDDGDVCTVDRCNEERKTCDRTPRDLDADGDADFFCPGGTDCDDFDPTRNGMVAEVCADLVDNDCDGTADEMECGRPDYDVCDDPLVIDASGTYVLDTGGAAPDYTIGCTGGVRQDLVAAIEIPADGPRDVTVEVQGDLFVTGASLRRDCTAVASEIACRTGYPARVRARALEPGRYYLVIASLGGPGEVSVTVELDEPTPRPANETCASAIEVPVPTGGTYRGSFVGVANDQTISCGSGAQPDLYYTFTIPEATGPQNVSVTLSSTTGEGMSFAVLEGCGGAERRCAYGSPASARTYRLAPGTYALVVEGPSYVEVDYTLTVAFEPPSDPPSGDLCTSAIPLTVGTPYTGTLVGAEDDLVIECSFRAPDLVHSFRLEAPSDVSVEVDGGRAYLSAAVATVCPVPTGMRSLSCVSGLPARARLRDLPVGDYFLFVEGARAGAYTVRVDATTPPTVAMPVSGNDTCGTAAVIPPTGGLFTGSTAIAMHQYAPTSCGSSGAARDVVFSLTLPTRRRVVASTVGSTFDTILYILGSACAGSDLACDDDGGGGGGASLIDRTLDAGTYYLVLDAFSSTGGGDYTLEVLVQDPAS